MKSKKPAVGFADECLYDKAQKLATALKRPLDNQALPRLNVTSDKLELLFEGFSPLFVDFSPKAWKKRQAAGKKQGLIRACKPTSGVRIVDATAGWGRDAALLASFGAHVQMVERNPIMAAMLEDALQRLEPASKMAHLLSLVCMDARAYLQTLSAENAPDVIYIDPMHPERQKTALVKKDMQALQQLLGTQDDAQALLDTALAYAKGRVVVKWPQREPPLRATTSQIMGKTVRFDVYTRTSNP